MSVKFEALLEAKQRLSASLLRSGRRGHVVAMTSTLRVNEAIAMADRNVHAVGIGPKIKDGEPQSQLCVRVYVVQKISPHLLPPAFAIPAAVGQVPTDVIESPPAFILARGRRDRIAAAVAAPACTVNRRSRQRPLVAGISAGHFNITAGTLGYFCRSTRHGDNPTDIYLLSNNHVFADVNQAQSGDDLYQPGTADGGSSSDTVADLSRWVDVELGGVEPNRVDAAIGKLRANVGHSAEICSIGAGSGTVEPAEDMVVCKHGRTTGYTEGKITDISYDALVGMDHNDTATVGLFTNQIRIARAAGFDNFAEGGDSGSLVVQKDGKQAVGLFFAGPPSGSYGVANRIADVLNELEIQLL